MRSPCTQTRTWPSAVVAVVADPPVLGQSRARSVARFPGYTPRVASRLPRLCWATRSQAVRAETNTAEGAHVCPNCAHRQSGSRIPDSNRLVRTATGQEEFAGPKADTKDRGSMSRQGKKGLVRLEFPQRHDLIMAGSCQTVSVGTEADPVHSVAMPLKQAQLLAGSHPTAAPSYRSCSWPGAARLG